MWASLAVVSRLWSTVAAAVAHGLSCSVMWNLSGAGTEPVSPAFS